MLSTVSCLCVSSYRVPFLKRAIACFLSQDYPSKELIIIFPDDDMETKQFLESVAHPVIKGYPINAIRNYSLGELRNKSVEKSTGEFICFWDDDDWYPDFRISVLMQAICTNHKPAAILVNWILFDKAAEKGYLSNKGIWAASMLAKKSLLSEEIKFPNVNKDEDFDFLMKTLKINCLCPVIAPSSYIYIYHGNNTCNKDHFQKLFSRAMPLPESLNKMITGIINGVVDIREGSEILRSNAFLKELDYFYTEANFKKKPQWLGAFLSSFLNRKSKTQNIT